MDEVATKSEPHHTVEGSCSSSLSTPEPEGEVVIQDPVQRQKRKGGRKPVGTWPFLRRRGERIIDTPQSLPYFPQSFLLDYWICTGTRG